jgi:hypothetical protein
MFVSAILNWFINTMAPVYSGALAVKQLDDDNASYFVSQFGVKYLTGNPLTVLIPLAILAWIWYKPIKNLIKGENAVKTSNPTIPMILLVAILSFMAISPASAYYDRKDKPEYYEIQPNQSAFLVPLVGANKTTQGQFMSVSYLDQNKVATKRISIPHVLMKMPGLDWDMYIPSAKLIIVDRTPYHREWATSKEKGTANSNQGIEVESADSVAITVDISIASYVTEQDAAKFLYYFGAKNSAANANDPYPSSSAGYSLTEVMDGYVRGAVQRTLAREFSKREFSKCLIEKNAIMEEAEKLIKAQFAGKGITIDYIGFAGQLNFDPAIQGKINDVIATRLDVLRYDALNKMLPLRMQEAKIKTQEAFAAMLGKWDGKIPWYVPNHLVEWVTKMMAPAVGK